MKCNLVKFYKIWQFRILDIVNIKDSRSIIQERHLHVITVNSICRQKTHYILNHAFFANIKANKLSRRFVSRKYQDQWLIHVFNYFELLQILLKQILSKDLIKIDWVLKLIQYINKQYIYQKNKREWELSWSQLTSSSQSNVKFIINECIMMFS